MILNGIMAVALRYFTEFGKPAFHHITASTRIELTDQKYICMSINLCVWLCPADRTAPDRADIAASAKGVLTGHLHQLKLSIYMYTDTYTNFRELIKLCM